MAYKLNDFDTIRPYTDAEVPAALQRIVNSRLLRPAMRSLGLEHNIDEVRHRLRSVHTVEEFQKQVMFPINYQLIRKTTAKFTSSGLEQLDSNVRYLFLSNHRDIVLDAAWLNYLLYRYAHRTSEISFGSNLMTNSFVIDFGKSNKMFRFERGAINREFYRNSMEVSAYMRYAITQKKESIWIAQRNGRAKDGYDKTEIAVLKMFALSGSDNFVDDMGQLNLCPVSVSYEYEPCDFLKVAEIYESRRHPYVKQKGEDMRSIIRGILQFKGRVHFSVCEPIMHEELEECNRLGRNEKFKMLADIIDQRIYHGYRLHKNNYIAYDLMHHCSSYASFYTPADKDAFVDYMHRGLGSLQTQRDASELESIFLGIYANTLANTLK